MDEKRQEQPGAKVLRLRVLHGGQYRELEQIHLHELELSPGAARTILELYRFYSVNVPHSDVVARWNRESMELAEKQWGTETRERMRLVKLYVLERPRLYEALEHSRIGSHPDVVEILVEAIWELQPGSRNA